MSPPPPLAEGRDAEYDGEDWDYEDGEEEVDELGRPISAGSHRRGGKGTGNAGKPGKRLRLEDLQSQFGVGLKEAANRLGICATTLKRACRCTETPFCRI